MFLDEMGGVWLTDPLALLAFGVAVFALLGAAHTGVAAGTDAGADSETMLPAAGRLALVADIAAALARAIAALDDAQQPRSRRGSRMLAPMAGPQGARQSAVGPSGASSKAPLRSRDLRADVPS